MMTLTATNATGGTRVSTPRPRAGYAVVALAPSAVLTSGFMPSGAQLDTTGVWGDVRVDGHIAASGQPAWSPPI
jgi:hypothetical protein